MPFPPPPARLFVSDNSAAAHPTVVDAVVQANAGHAVAYGADPWTRECEERFRSLFGPQSQALLTLNGTGGNVMALATMLRPAEAVVCAANAHVAADEAGAPERILGAKVMELPSADGKLRPEQLDEVAHLLGVEHHVQPGVVSLTQSTELGAVYTPSEVAAVCERARSFGMRVHMDGARIANAVAARGGGLADLRAMTVDAGVDVITFGGTKNGLLGGEAVVFLTPEFARPAKFVRKQVNQLSSKMRYLAAQFNAILDDGLWLDLAAHANAMALRLYELTAAIPGVEHDGPPQVNSLFPRLPADVIEPLREWSFFWPWDRTINQVRWMTSWDTTDEDLAAFAAGVRHALGESSSR